MGTIISMADFRERRDVHLSVMARLERAVARLDGIIHRRPGRMSETVERELLMIARAVSLGAPRDAAIRAERLAGLLEHPAASRS